MFFILTALGRAPKGLQSMLTLSSTHGILILIYAFCLVVLEVLFDPCRTWCPASTCQAVCQLQDIGLQTPQLVQCKACDMEFCSACKARWHPGQGCPETMPISFLPGETRYCVGAVVQRVGWGLRAGGWEQGLAEGVGFLPEGLT